ncbi:MAG TPA: glycosyltransferase family 61 protein [Ferruginibacter sp.]|nr:glycosyltransferase family 61 protein [Ferruginibacter sp.]
MIRNKVISESFYSREQPLNIKSTDQHLFLNAYESRLPSIIVTIVKDADVLNDTIFKLSRVTFLKGTHTHKLGIRRVLRSLALYFKPDIIYVDKAIWIIDNFSFGYYHWFIECLTRLVAAKKFINNHKIILPAKFRDLKYVSESIVALGYDVYYYDIKKRLRVHELVLPSHATNNMSCNPTIINLLSKTFDSLNTYDNVPVKLVYITRKQAGARRIVNEEELLPIFSKFNIEVHCLENYSFSQQLSLLQSTKVLIGPHGAGLTNMLFMPKGNSIIIELRNKADKYWNMFFTLATDLGHDYLYLLGDAISSEFSQASDTHNADLYIDARELDQFLSKWLTRDLYR